MNNTIQNPFKVGDRVRHAASMTTGVVERIDGPFVEYVCCGKWYVHGFRTLELAPKESLRWRKQGL